MLYCTYKQYQTAGGTLDEAAFDTLCARASRLIDRHTFGRAGSHAKVCTDCAEALAMACASIVQSLERAEAARAATGYAPGVTSVNNDGFAVTFSEGHFPSGLQRKRRASSPTRWAATPTACCIGGVSEMQCSVTVVNLIHDTATETDRLVCHVIPGCSWREKQDTSGGDPQRTVHVRLPPAAGYLPYFQWAKLPPGEKAAHWTLKRGGKLICGAVRSLTEAEYAALEKTHICCTVAAVSDNREPLLPHFHVEGS